jgi:hypothetical protein
MPATAHNCRGDAQANDGQAHQRLPTQQHGQELKIEHVLECYFGAGA